MWRKQPASPCSPPAIPAFLIGPNGCFRLLPRRIVRQAIQEVPGWGAQVRASRGLCPIRSSQSRPLETPVSCTSSLFLFLLVRSFWTTRASEVRLGCGSGVNVHGYPHQHILVSFAEGSNMVGLAVGSACQPSRLCPSRTFYHVVSSSLGCGITSDRPPAHPLRMLHSAVARRRPAPIEGPSQAVDAMSFALQPLAL